MSPKSNRKRRTRLWFAFYTLVLVAVGIWSIVAQQWSVALTALGIGEVFALFTRGLWRRR
jgi:hypothetical protein